MASRNSAILVFFTAVFVFLALILTKKAFFWYFFSGFMFFFANIFFLERISRKLFFSQTNLTSNQRYIAFFGFLKLVSWLFPLFLFLYGKNDVVSVIAFAAGALFCLVLFSFRKWLSNSNVSRETSV